MKGTEKVDLQIDPNYFDYAASTPTWPEALQSFNEVSQAYYANPSSIHLHGKSSRQKMQELRKEFCDLAHFFDGRFLLCSSGTEANNLIIEGHLEKFPEANILIGEDVHDSIWYATKKHKKRIRTLPIDGQGFYVTEKMPALTDGITLVCINHVCNETGVIQQVEEIAAFCSDRKIRLLVDGMQSFGHVDIDLNSLPCDYYTISGHKFGAVKGTGGVFMRDSQIAGQMLGGRQEWDLRAGTENVAGLASMTSAYKMCKQSLEQESNRLMNLQSQLVEQLSKLNGIRINSPEGCLPGFLSVSFSGYSGRELVGALSMSGIAVSTGSACHANEMSPSRVLLAMGLTKKEATGAIRISMGRSTTEASVTQLAEKLSEIVA